MLKLLVLVCLTLARVFSVTAFLHTTTTRPTFERISVSVWGRLSDSIEEDTGDRRAAKQQAIKDIIAQRQPHQKRSNIRPGTRVLLAQEIIEDPEEGEGVDIGGNFRVVYPELYEGLVEVVLTKEKTHPLGIKVRCVGNVVGRVAAILSKGQQAALTAELLGAELKPLKHSKGIRTRVMANSAAVTVKNALPYSVTNDQWVPTGPAAKALAALQALEAEEAGEKDQSASRKSKKNRFGESGKKKMERQVIEQKERAAEKRRREGTN